MQIAIVHADFARSSWSVVNVTSFITLCSYVQPRCTVSGNVLVIFGFEFHYLGKEYYDVAQDFVFFCLSVTV